MSWMLSADGWELALIARCARGAPADARRSAAVRSSWLSHTAAGSPSGSPASTATPILAASRPKQSCRHVTRWNSSPGSRVQRALGGAARIAVNTIHHHGIADPGELEVTGTAPGGVIEAVEPRADWHCVGVQWHPEKMHEPSQRGLFAQLVAACRERSGVVA